MKVIIVNQSKIFAKYITSRDVQFLIKKISDYFFKKRIKNKTFLMEKKELTIVYLSVKEMQKINKQFRNKNKPTDILSFESHDPRSLGELLLCFEVLKKQAQNQKHSIKCEVAYMLIHGILHLLGYDHELSLKDEKLMFRLQDTCFEELGIYNIFKQK